MMNKKAIKLKPIATYVENGVTITVYPEKKTKRNLYWSGGSLVLLSSLSKRGIPEDSMFQSPTRKRLK